MKILLLIVLTLLGFTPVFSQTFEGFIVYQNEVKSKNLKVSDAQFLSLVGSVQKSFYAANGDYINILKGGMVRMQYYKGSENLIYILLASNDTLYYKDAGITSDNVIKHELVEEVELVLSKQCNKLNIYTSQTVLKYYFSNDYSMDPSIYSKHGFGNWNYIIEKTKALPLKFIIETPQFIATSTAVEIREEKIDPEIFKIPDGAVKAPYRW